MISLFNTASLTKSVKAQRSLHQSLMSGKDSDKSRSAAKTALFHHTDYNAMKLKSLSSAALSLEMNLDRDRTAANAASNITTKMRDKLAFRAALGGEFQGVQMVTLEEPTYDAVESKTAYVAVKKAWNGLNMTTLDLRSMDLTLDKISISDLSISGDPQGYTYAFGLDRNGNLYINSGNDRFTFGKANNIDAALNNVKNINLQDWWFTNEITGVEQRGILKISQAGNADLSSSAPALILTLTFTGFKKGVDGKEAEMDVYKYDVNEAFTSELQSMRSEMKVKLGALSQTTLYGGTKAELITGLTKDFDNISNIINEIDATSSFDTEHMAQLDHLVSEFHEKLVDLDLARQTTQTAAETARDLSDLYKMNATSIIETDIEDVSTKLAEATSAYQMNSALMSQFAQHNGKHHTSLLNMVIEGGVKRTQSYSNRKTG